MCSVDPSNVLAVDAFYAVGDCLTFNATAAFGLPGNIKSGKPNECGESFDYFTDSHCTNLAMSEFQNFTYSCLNNNTIDDQYFDDNQIGDDHFESMGSLQHFCDKSVDKPKPDHHHKEKPSFSKPQPGAKGKMKPQEFSLDFDLLMAEYTEQTEATATTYKLAVAGGLLCFAGAMVAKFYKSKTGFESVPVESMHSSI